MYVKAKRASILKERALLSQGKLRPEDPERFENTFR